jgi:hypothetical protein
LASVEQAIASRRHGNISALEFLGEISDHVFNTLDHSKCDFPFLGMVNLHAQVFMDLAPMAHHLPCCPQ